MSTRHIPELNNYAVILLAAGEARRFGGGKLLADLGGKPIVQHVRDTVKIIDSPKRIVVTVPEVARYIDWAGWQVQINGAPERGLSRSIHLGVEIAVAAGASAVLIVLGDMPRVTPAHLQKVLHTGCSHPDGIAFSVREGKRMPPAFFAGRWYPQLRSLEEDQGARSILATAPEGAGVDATADTLVDVDTPADLEQLHRA